MLVPEIKRNIYMFDITGKINDYVSLENRISRSLQQIKHVRVLYRETSVANSTSGINIIVHNK